MSLRRERLEGTGRWELRRRFMWRNDDCLFFSPYEREYLKQSVRVSRWRDVFDTGACDARFGCVSSFAIVKPFLVVADETVMLFESHRFVEEEAKRFRVPWV